MSMAWGYEGRRVVVSGGGGAGMGAARVDDLVELGAEVHVLDLKDSSAKVAGHHKADLRDPAAIDAAVERIGGPVHALFNCAGLPGKPHSGMDTMLVNFVAARHLTNRVAPLMDGGGGVATISSAGGVGWDQMLDVLGELIATDGYDEARAWLEARPELVGEGYLLSKQAIIVWTMHAALDLAPQGIRVNCTSPGPTDTPMMPAFVASMGAEFMEALPRPLGRNSTREEQAHILAFLNSDMASYISGANVFTDGGFWAGLTTNRLGF
jgi:NAD(P)-dependent dehydrogenase (short-subunit alcohol dehydrogenase family)